MPAKTKVPPAVGKALIREKAAVKPFTPGIYEELANEFGLKPTTVRNFLINNRQAVSDARGKAADAFIVLAGQASARLAEALASDARIAETPVRDLALVVEKMTNAAVTAADGHKPIVSINFGEIRERKAKLDAYDRAKQVGGKEVSC